MYPQFFHCGELKATSDFENDLEDTRQKGLYKTHHFDVFKGSEEFGYFKFSPFPDCSGVVISHNTYVRAEFRGTVYSDLFRTFKQEIAQDLGYGLMIATCDIDNTPALGNFLKSSYDNLQIFKNKRYPHHTVALGVKKI